MFDVGRTLLAATARNSDAIALIDGDRRMTYGELLDAALRTVTCLDKLGIHKGDHMLVVMQNRAEMAILHWAAQLAAVVITPGELACKCC